MTRTQELRGIAVGGGLLGLAVVLAVAPLSGAVLYLAAAVLLWAGARWGLADHPFAKLGAANIVTYGRGLGVAVLASLPTAPLGDTARSIVAIAAALMIAADGLDGWLARRNGTASAFGARFDMEVDAALMLVLSILAARLESPWLILLGLPRYIFVAAAFLWPFLSAPLPPSERRRIVCVVQGFGLVAAIWPWSSGPAVAFVALAALLWSFAVDIGWLWHNAISRAIENGLAPLRGLLRSIAIYWFVPGRQAKLDRFYARWIGPGKLGFDIGAHAGNRTASWRRLGAAVVAVEPQPLFADFLARLFVDDTAVKLERIALGERDGILTLRISDRHPTVTSGAADFVAQAATAPGYENVAWNRSVTVPMTTLDTLIARHGAPAFVKIDVEGAEAQVLAGVTQALPALSFEYAWATKGAALACIARLETRGAYRFNRATGESLAFVGTEWIDAPAIRAFLEGLTPGDKSGDIYAELATHPGAPR
jgi:FkbM family methyltransferase